MFVSSSYWSDNVGLAASLATIRELKRRDSEAVLKEMGQKTAKIIDEAVASSGLAGSCEGFPTTPGLVFNLPDGADGPKVQTLFIQEMAKRGVHGYTGFGPTHATPAFHSASATPVSSGASGPMMASSPPTNSRATSGPVCSTSTTPCGTTSARRPRTSSAS